MPQLNVRGDLILNFSTLEKQKILITFIFNNAKSMRFFCMFSGTWIQYGTLIVDFKEADKSVPRWDSGRDGLDKANILLVYLHTNYRLTILTTKLSTDCNARVHHFTAVQLVLVIQFKTFHSVLGVGEWYVCFPSV